MWILQPTNVFTMEKYIKMGTVFLMIAIHAHVKMEEFNVPKLVAFLNGQLIVQM